MTSEYTVAEQQKAAKWCDAYYFEEILKGGENRPQSSLRIIDDGEDLKAVEFEEKMVVIELREGTVMRLPVDTANVAIDTTNLMPLDEDIDSLRRHNGGQPE